MAKKITRVGRYKVEDGSRPYEPGQDLSLRELAGYERRAARTVLRDVEHVEPAVIRHARKVLGLTQVELGELLDIGAETISRWENGAEAFKRTSQLALADLLDQAERAGGELPKPEPWSGGNLKVA